MAQIAQNNEFVKEWAWNWTFNELRDNDHSRLVITIKNKVNSFEQEELSSTKSKEGLFFYISLRLIQNYSSWVYNDFSQDFIIIPFVMGFFSFIFPPLLSSQPSTCRPDC